MERRTARGNRIGLGIVGAALLLAGLAVLARALDLMPDLLGSAEAPLTDQTLRDFASDQTWFWPVLAAVLIVIALLSLRWLAVQTRTGAVGTLRLDPNGFSRGITRLPAGAVASALAEDLDRSPYLSRPRVGLTGSPVRPNLRVTVALSPAGEPDVARDRVREALDRTRLALESPELPTTVRLR